MPRVLVVEKTGHIQALLKERFSADHISVDAVPFDGGALEKIKTQGYDVLIWDAAASKTEQSKGLELLDLLTRDSNKTYIIVLAEQEGGPFPLDRLKAYAHRTLTRPVHEAEVCALVAQAVHQQALRNGGGIHREMPLPL